MIDLTSAVRLTAALRRRRLRRLDPVETQRRTLTRLLRRAAGTRFGRDYGFDRIGDVAAYQAAVPLRRFEEMWRDYWQPAFPMLQDISWPGGIPFFWTYLDFRRPQRIGAHGEDLHGDRLGSPIAREE